MLIELKINICTSRLLSLCHWKDYFFWELMCISDVWDSLSSPRTPFFTLQEALFFLFLGQASFWVSHSNRSLRLNPSCCGSVLPSCCLCNYCLVGQMDKKVASAFWWYERLDLIARNRTFKKWKAHCSRNVCFTDKNRVTAYAFYQFLLALFKLFLKEIWSREIVGMIIFLHLIQNTQYWRIFCINE